MKIYKNKELTQEITTLDLGIVEAGKSKEFTFYIFNDTIAELRDLEFIIDNQEIEIKEFPSILVPKAYGELVILWKPSITLKEGLKTTLNVRGKELWG